MPREDRRAPNELRPVTLERNASAYAEGSCLVQMGGTHVLCTASVEEWVPPWRRDSGLGWVTAEYAMLPRATTTRSARERRGPGGRTAEIQRLIGRSLRAALRDFAFGPRTVQVDCDVLQADGGTRTASITGASVALADACEWMVQKHGITSPFQNLVAGVSVGIVDNEPRLDLSYAEDKHAQVDANIVIAEPDRFVEVQGTAEGRPFSQTELDQLLVLARGGAEQLFAAQRQVLGW